MDSSFLGLVVATSSVVLAERRKQSVRQIFPQLRASYSEVTIAVPAVTIMELAHGVERAKSQHLKDERNAFLEDLTIDMKIYPMTNEIARLAGKIFGQQSCVGITIPFEDLIIGTTALHHGCQIESENVKHFELIPSLAVKYPAYFQTPLL